MTQSPRVVIVDQDPDARFHVQQMVTHVGFTVSGQAGLGTEAVAQVTELTPDIVLCGLKEPLTRVVQTMESIAHAAPDVALIVYSASGDLETARQAMLAGARDFLQTPLKPEELRRSLTAALEAVERRRMREAGSSVLGPDGAIITVFGAKGGIGKTTVAANLAVALVHNAGQQVVLVDADDTFGDVSATLTVTPERTVTDTMRSLDGADGEALKKFLTYHDSGLAIAPGPMSPFEWREANTEQFELLLHRLARQFDVVLVDTSGTLSKISETALEAASLILWVTTPEYASIRDSLQAMDAIRTVLKVPEERIRLVLNMTSPEVEVQPHSVEEALNKEIFWTIPYDRHVRRNSQLGRSLVEAHPNSQAAKHFANLALVLSGRPPVIENGKLLGRFLAKRERRFLKRQQAEAKP